MKMLSIVALVIFLAGTCTAMTSNQSAYLDGFNDGWYMAYLRFYDHDEYNRQIQIFNDDANASLNESEASKIWLAPYEFNYTLPEVFR